MTAQDNNSWVEPRVAKTTNHFSFSMKMAKQMLTKGPLNTTEDTKRNVQLVAGACYLRGLVHGILGGVATAALLLFTNTSEDITKKKPSKEGVNVVIKDSSTVAKMDSTSGISIQKP